MNAMPALLITCLCALGAPLIANVGSRAFDGTRDAPRWPSHFQGRMLSELPLTARERAFLRDFPGAVARFTDGERDIVLRWVTRATRRLHPAADCYRGLGYVIAASQIVTDGELAQWRCFTARRDGEARQVCEQLRDREGNRWTDVSAWYWAATLQRSEGPWLVTTVATRL